MHGEYNFAALISHHIIQAAEHRRTVGGSRELRHLDLHVDGVIHNDWSDITHVIDSQRSVAVVTTRPPGIVEIVRRQTRTYRDQARSSEDRFAVHRLPGHLNIAVQGAELP